MLALPGRISKRTVGDPDMPIRILGEVRRLELHRGCVVIAYKDKEQAIDITGLPPAKYTVGRIYEFLGMATEQSVLAFWGRQVPEDFLDLSLDDIAQTIDVIESSILFQQKRKNKSLIS